MTEKRICQIKLNSGLAIPGFLAGLTLFGALDAYAQQIDAAIVVARQPNFVTILQQQCQQVPVQISNQNTGGTIVGGVLGAAIGNQVGRGDGKTVATAVGAVLGSQLGGSQGATAGAIEYRTQCNNVPVQVQQGEIVTFEYRGRRFSQSFP
ncbi:MAG: glycine zipper 2TM domain-containing protein [Betaproteobacteria bacterium]|nr:glycine zipper 2TM domain-containing protein [Betaproteobacteria bacterium]